MFLGLVVALLVIGFSPISEAASIEGKREKATIQKQNVEEQDTEENSLFIRRGKYNRKRERTEFLYRLKICLLQRRMSVQKAHLFQG